MEPTTTSIPAQTDNPDTATCELAEESTSENSPLPYLVTCRHGEWRGEQPGDASLIALKSHGELGLAANTAITHVSGTPRASAELPEVPMAWRVAADLRQLADLLDQHPELAFGNGYRSCTADLWIGVDKPEQVDAWARALDVDAADGRVGPTRERQVKVTRPHGLSLKVHADLPHPTQAEIDAALAFYREHGPAAGEPS